MNITWHSLVSRSHGVISRGDKCKMKSAIHLDLDKSKVSAVPSRTHKGTKKKVRTKRIELLTLRTGISRATIAPRPRQFESK